MPFFTTTWQPYTGKYILTDTSIRRKPGDDPCRFSVILLLLISTQDGELSKTDNRHFEIIKW